MQKYDFFVREGSYFWGEGLNFPREIVFLHPQLQFGLKFRTMKKQALVFLFVFLTAFLGRAQENTRSATATRDNPAPATVPYYCGFEDAAERDCWTFHQNTNYNNNKWTVGTATHSEGEYALYVTNYSATGYTYDVTRESIAWVYRDVFFDSENQEYIISFDFKGMGERINQNTYDYLNVYVGPPAEIEDIYYNTYNPTVDPPEGATLFLEKLCQNSDWTNYLFTVDASFSGVQRIYFMWRNDGSGGTQPPAAIDNLSITPVACAKPSFLTANVVDTTLVLSWMAITGADSYSILYKESSDSIYIERSSPYNYLEINDFQYRTSYDWKVRSNCADDEHSSWSESTFQTLVPSAHLPYYFGFEDSTENAKWLLFNGEYTNQWHIGGAVQNGGDSALYISNDGGVSNAYSTGNSSSVWACRDLFIPENVSSFSLSFDFKGMGETYSSTKYDYMQVYLGPPAVPAGFNVPEGAIELSGQLNETGEWTAIHLMDTGGHTGMQRLYFRWANDGNRGTNPPASIDNIVIEGSACPTPIYLYSSNILDYSAELSWIEEVPSASYTVAYRAEEDSIYTEITLQTNHCPLTGLTPGTIYIWKVKTHCSADQESIWSMEQTFQTFTPLGRIPYSCGFEDTEENVEWQAGSPEQIHWQIGTAAHHFSNHGLYVGYGQYNYIPEEYCVGGNACWAYRDIYFDPSENEYELSFYHKCGGEWGNPDETPHMNALRVFVGPPSDIFSNGVPEGAEQLGATITRDLSWTRHSYLIDQRHQGVQRLWFLWTPPYHFIDNPPSAVDDISIVGVSCGRPLNVSCFSEDVQSLSVHFTPCFPDDDTWELAIIEEGEDWADARTFVIHDTLYLLQNLYPHTTYFIRLRTVCGENEYSDWTVSVASRTACGEVIRLPFTENFDHYGTDPYPTCWSRIVSSNEDYPIIDYSHQGSAEPMHSLPAVLAFSSFNSSAPKYNYAITPPFSEDIPMSRLIVQYKYFYLRSTWTVSVGVMEDPEDESTFVAVGTLQRNPDREYYWTDEIAYLSSYTGNGRYIAFRFSQDDYGLSKFDIDNIVIDTVLTHEGVADRGIDPFVMVYPNPASDVVNVCVQEGMPEITETEVYDINGRLLHTVKGSGQQLQIPVAGLARGMYFVKIYSGEKAVVKRFVKQ